MKTTHLKGLSVVNIGTGEKVGSVSEILLDPLAHQVTGFAVATGGGTGLFANQSSPTNWLAAGDVHAIGPDALTIKDASVLSEQAIAGEMTSVSLLVDEKVVTEGGTFVGKVTAVEIDETAMEVTGLEVSAGFFKSNLIVAKADFITVGEELVIVADSVCAETPEAAADEANDDAAIPMEATDVYGARRETANEQ